MEIRSVNPNQRKVLENLLQLYLHEMSGHYPAPYNYSNGTFDYDLDSYFTEPTHKAYYILNNNKIVGFALLIINNDFIRPQEMFILNQYRDKGLGSFTLKRLFDKYKGKWELKVPPHCKRLERLWTRLVKEYTKGNYQTDRVGTYNRLVITFNNK